MIGIVIFGVLLLIIFAGLAFDYFLVGKGYNLGHLILSIVSFSIVIIWIFVNVDEIKDSKDLAINGKEVWATVIEGNIETKHQRRRVKVNYINTIDYDGNEKNFNLDRIYKKGSKIKLVYSQKNPSNAKIMERQESILDYYLSDKTLLSLLFPIFSLLSVILFSYLFFNKKT